MRSADAGHFNRSYIIFAVTALSLVLGYTGWMMSITGQAERYLWPSVLFVFLFALICVLWLGVMRRRMANIVDTLDQIVEGAIRGQARVTGYSETNLSSLENKLIRYIDLSFHHERKIEAEKNKIKELISDISHQTKTPLSNIVLYSQLLAEQSGLEGDTQQWVKQIRTQADKLDWLIQSLIKMSRLETGIIAMHPDSTSVIDTITRGISQIYRQAEQKGISITIDCDTAIHAHHDPKWTSEVLFNLLDNAVKYSEPGGRIHISVAAYELFVRIDIADTGIGIEEDELHSVFKRFYRCKRTASFEGVGIGLYLAREILSAQGGYIKAASKPGQGTTFSVFLLADGQAKV
ncbi:sensor histidine kinase [Paenibacillus aceti]|uniref:histidine kinase n=1 Tax=Paenibacillus aceti TaxID=1820010 RepID=A0ABQ1VW25_9BACL|nr:HAMP domain-containing sensor histidine kinase [Paenibacillus aceti]GGG00255.1 two-component sensor histidine kinase [Paenibacillus aceti]